MRYIVAIRLSNGNEIHVGVNAESTTDAAREFAEKSKYIEDKISEVAEGATIVSLDIHKDDGTDYAVNQARLINPDVN